MWNALLAGLVAYLLGSIPFGYLLFRLRQGADIRTTGSGGIGATNVLRTSGWLAAALTLLLDAGKGYWAVVLAGQLAPASTVAAAIAIVLVMAGHCYPVFLGFRGGKGVATGFGAFLAVAPLAVLIGGVVFLVVLALRRIVSLASLSAAVVFPVALAAGRREPWPVLAASVAAAALIVARHRANLQRLRAGTERPVFGPGSEPR